ncbi:MAG: methyltransferase domain-containing protein [Candidatus Nitrosotenuis sp.]|nr:methyltransferase domain-containing protein [Candidatus Nitrosotenuis sp.]
MKIEEYIASLPPSIISGEQVQLLDDSVREILKFAEVGKDDVFYHLGCGTGNGLAVAEEFCVRKAVGVDIDPEKISDAQDMIAKKNLKNSVVRCEDILNTDMSDATAVLFWFSDTSVTEKMLDRFSSLGQGCKIITIFDPLPGILPSRVSFPYILHQTPLKQAKTLRDQLIAVFDTECIDFTTAWEFAERYTKAVGSPDAGNDRFLTILQTMMIWINARKLGLSCTDEIPPAVQSYIEILRNFFGIEVKHLIE